MELRTRLTQAIDSRNLIQLSSILEDIRNKTKDIETGEGEGEGGGIVVGGREDQCGLSKEEIDAVNKLVVRLKREERVRNEMGVRIASRDVGGLKNILKEAEELGMEEDIQVP